MARRPAGLISYQDPFEGGEGGTQKYPHILSQHAEVQVASIFCPHFVSDLDREFARKLTTEA